MLALTAAAAAGSIAARSVRPLQSVVETTVTDVTAANAAASMAMVDSVLGLRLLQSVPLPDALVAELSVPVEAEADVEALALTSGALAEALALTSADVDVLALAPTDEPPASTPTLVLVSTPAETLAVWAKVELDRVQTAISSAAADNFDMMGSSRVLLIPLSLQPTLNPWVAPIIKDKFCFRSEPFETALVRAGKAEKDSP